MVNEHLLRSSPDTATAELREASYSDALIQNYDRKWGLPCFPGLCFSDTRHRRMNKSCNAETAIFWIPTGKAALSVGWEWPFNTVLRSSASIMLFRSHLTLRDSSASEPDDALDL
jgi:hypothetical protein